MDGAPGFSTGFVRGIAGIEVLEFDGGHVRFAADDPEAADRVLREAIERAMRSINRYPDREFTQLREHLTAYVGEGTTPEQIWAANGSNEVMLHLLQAFGGPGRTAVRRGRAAWAAADPASGRRRRRGC